MGPYERHSNDLVWRESGAKIVRYDDFALLIKCNLNLNLEL